MSRAKHDAGFMIVDDTPDTCEQIHARIDGHLKAMAQCAGRNRRARFECGVCHRVFEPLNETKVS